MSQNDFDQAFFATLPKEERERFIDELENEFADLNKAIEPHVQDFRQALIRRPLVIVCCVVASFILFLHPPIFVVAIIWLPLLLSLICHMLLRVTTIKLFINIRNFCTALRWDVAMSSITSDIKPTRVVRQSEPMETVPKGRNPVQ